MSIQIITTDKAPAAIGPYSQAISCNGFIYTSGQLGLDPATGELAHGFEEQAERAIQNIGEILAAADLTYSDVIKTTCFLADMADFPVFNAIYSRFFTSKPARSCIGVAALPKGASVELEVVAAVN
jgi:endoribonuclease L-PSP, putative